jgi:hypothetical protein
VERVKAEEIKNAAFMFGFHNTERTKNQESRMTIMFLFCFLFLFKTDRQAQKVITHYHPEPQR